MPHDSWPDGLYADVAELAGRGEDLRQAAGLPGADSHALLQAAFAELDAAVEILAKLAQDDAGPPGVAQPASSSTEHALLRAVFHAAPAALLVLEPDGTIRWANAAAGDLIGVPPGYATGKPLAAFVALGSRAAVQSQLPAAAPTGMARQVDAGLVTPAGRVGVTLTANVAKPQEGTQFLVVTAAATPRAYGQRAPGAETGQDASRSSSRPDGEIQAMTRRMDMITAVTRLLLDNSTFSEAVTLQRCARLLAGDVASWVIVDIERDGQLRRQFVVGPPDSQDGELSRRLRTGDPRPGSVPAQVHVAGRSVVVAHADDSTCLGAGQDGTPLLLALGATSLLSVPIRDRSTSYGVLTLARQAADGRFGLADLGLVHELGQPLGVSIRVDRMFRHRSAVAEALQSSLLPARLPDIPGIEMSAAYLPASEGVEVSGDFYDVFPVSSGWAIAVGDVCGKGQEAAPRTAAARHAIRAVAHWNPDPADVLAKANEVILDGDYEDRFVTVKLAYLRRDGDHGKWAAELASSGHPGPAVIRPDGQIDMM